jgi:hypothetical protein
MGFDADVTALETAFQRTRRENLNFTPLYQDLVNPNPDQGWKNRERLGFEIRCNADAVIALALIHHLVNGKNIPMGEAITWITDRATIGVIEFVPRDDPMVEAMPRRRKHNFEDYSEERFLDEIRGRTIIENCLAPNFRAISE